MALYERLLGNEAKLPVHAFQSIIAEWARGRITVQQARDAVTFVSGTALTPAEEAEAQTLVNTVPVGQTTANRADRAVRIQEIDQVMLMIDQKIPPYNTAVAIKIRLGV